MKTFFAASAITSVYLLFRDNPHTPLWLLIIEALITIALNIFLYKWVTRQPKGN